MSYSPTCVICYYKNLNEATAFSTQLSVFSSPCTRPSPSSSCAIHQYKVK